VTAVVGTTAYTWYCRAEEEKRAKALRADPRFKRVGPKPRSSTRGIVLSIIGGMAMGVFFPAITEAVSDENGVSAYGAMLLVAGGIFGSSILYVPFFLNFPVEGEPRHIFDYFKGTKGQHALGVLGGVLWGLGVLAALVADEAEAARVSPAVSYSLTRGGVIVTALLGMTLWGELPESTWRVKMMQAASVVLFLAGLGLLAMAPLYGG
jgi:glucose uptake protein